MEIFERFSFLIAGDSGDGIQLLGQNLSFTLAKAGKKVKTVSFFPAEIRSPAGTTHGISAMQVCFSSEKLWAPSSKVDCLIALNPAAYSVCKDKLRKGGRLIVDKDLWGEKHWKKAGLPEICPHSLAPTSLEVPLTTLTLEACSQSSLTFAQAKKNKNFTALGLALWMSQSSLETSFSWLREKFALKPALLDPAKLCLQAGYHLGETAELEQCTSAETQKNPGDSKESFEPEALLTGNQAFVLGAVSIAARSGQKVRLYGYPITPSSDILEYAKKWPETLSVFQAEDEMAAMGMALGAAWGGKLAITCTSGPGFDLKAELIGLGVSAELPCVVINVQRAGPSTGMPTKVEQSDLLSALYGRHGDCPVPVLAASSAESCFSTIEKACLWAIKAQTPVIVLSDAVIAQSTGQIPLRYASREHIQLPRLENVEYENPFIRDKNGVKHWTIPGQVGLQHAIGGLEKDKDTGQVSYEAENHAQMTALRAQKVLSLGEPLNWPDRTEHVKTLFVSFGSSSMALKQWLADRGEEVLADSLALTDLCPLPTNLQKVFSAYEHIIVVEINNGQLYTYLKSHVSLSSYNWHSWAYLGSSMFDDEWLENCWKVLTEEREHA